jgi:hypothetical protein
MSAPDQVTNFAEAQWADIEAALDVLQVVQKAREATGTSKARKTRRRYRIREPDQVGAFDYTEAQWAEIEATTQWAHKGPLPESVRKDLLNAARFYRWAVKQPKAPEGREEWQQIADDSRELQLRLLICARQSIDELHEYWQCSQKIEVLLAAEFFRLARGLCNLEVSAAFFAEWHKDNSHCYQRNYRAREAIALATLQAWHVLGGKLGKSPSGPLARFVLAVTRPVMGAHAPSPNSTREMVELYERSTRTTHTEMRAAPVPILDWLRAVYGGNALD